MVFSSGQEKRITASAAAFERALTELAKQSFCFVELSGSNRGVAAQVSFNPATYVDDESGLIEIALSAAKLAFEPIAEIHNVAWSEEILDLFDRERVITEIVQSDISSDERDTSKELGANGRVRVKLQAGEHVDVAAGAGGGAIKSSRTGQRREIAQVTSYGISDKHLMISRTTKGGFVLRFGSPPGENLTRYNADFNRLPLIDVGGDSQINPKDLDVWMSLDFAGGQEEVLHSLHILRATGVWRVLNEHPTRRVLGELLISKFLRPLHESKQLWGLQGAA